MSNTVRALTETPQWWTIRRAQNLKPATYRCPFCDEFLASMSEHALIAPEGDLDRRRHAHTECVLAARKAGRLPLREEVEPPKPSLWKRLRRQA